VLDPLALAADASLPAPFDAIRALPALAAAAFLAVRAAPTIAADDVLRRSRLKPPATSAA